VLEQLLEQEGGAPGADLGDHLLERLEPLGGLLRVGVGLGQAPGGIEGGRGSRRRRLLRHGVQVIRFHGASPMTNERRMRAGRPIRPERPPPRRPTRRRARRRVAGQPAPGLLQRVK